MNLTKMISPKVTWGALWAGLTGIGVTAGLAAINSVTADGLAFLGPWSGIAQAVLSMAAGILAGYRTIDPARTELVAPAEEYELPESKVGDILAEQVDYQPLDLQEVDPATGKHAA